MCTFLTESEIAFLLKVFSGDVCGLTDSQNMFLPSLCSIMLESNQCTYCLHSCVAVRKSEAENLGMGKKFELKSLFSFSAKVMVERLLQPNCRKKSLPCTHAKAPVSAHFY